MKGFSRNEFDQISNESNDNDSLINQDHLTEEE